MSEPSSSLKFSKEDDELLVTFIAKNNPSMAGRKGKNLYKRLVEEHSTRQTWSQWKSRYMAYANYYDSRVAQILGPDFVAPEVKGRKPYTSEDRQNFIEYLAKHSGPSKPARGIAIYRQLAENVTGDAPWGSTRTATGWREFYKRNAETFEPQIKEYQMLHGIVTDRIPGDSNDGPAAESDDSIPSRVLAYIDAVQEDNRVKRAPKSPKDKNNTGTGSPATTDGEFEMHPPSVPVSPSVGFGSFTVLESPHASSSQIGFNNSEPSISVARSEVIPEPVDSDTEYFIYAVTQIPRYGIFTPQDDLVLLKYMSKKRTPNRKAESLYQEMVQTIPAAGRHTAQAWRTRYVKHQHVFDRLVSDYQSKHRHRGKEKRRNTLQQQQQEPSTSSLQPVTEDSREISIGDLWGITQNKRKRESENTYEPIKRQNEASPVSEEVTESPSRWALTDESHEVLSAPQRISAWTSNVHEADQLETEDELAEEKEISQYLLG
ncbi:hypothetical protein Moror_7559 [Moniliophthora roreri MCA 2997]|uniref:DNA-binding protein RAP1 n=2 Tax=Moniliophthora roreri TaxID=221103 RepID=V2XWY7_MONRO|nr:hypothetical protein Moror_7559 [Moniliophthora roreri MCA 2997]KAI3619644.1 hypothetical protein WG66_002985 [Moniliophthora roreri]